MVQAVIIPKLGQTVEQATIVRWHKHPGSKVKKGEVLFEIETDKAVLEAESYYDGTILKILAGEGETVPVSTVVAYIGKEGERIPEQVAQRAAAPIATKKPQVNAPPHDIKQSEALGRAVAAESAQLGEAPGVPSTVPLERGRPGRLVISPRARALAKECAINPARITGTGPNSRIVVKDVECYLLKQGYDKIRITPAAKVVAAKQNIDILEVKGRGEAGRITVGDIKRAVAEKPKPMSRMRQVIARRLTQSFTTTPHFYVTVDVDMTDILSYREELKDRGEVYSITDFILKSVICSLQEFPMLNSVSDGTTVRWHGGVDLGMAVGLDEGLLVPVIRDAESLSIRELHDSVAALADKARSGKLLPYEMNGSTFTVSNMGMFDVENFTAIINPGESGILATASTAERVVAIEGRMRVRSMMKITLSSDHRIVDGAAAAGFINAVKSKLENVDLWKSLT